MSENLSSTEKLFQKYLSKPYNPRLASIFIKSGMIEAWGRVFEKYEKHGGSLPKYEINEDGIMVLCESCDSYLVYYMISQNLTKWSRCG